jgi:hypothetical protein
MAGNLCTVIKFIELLRSSNLGSETHNMLEYLLYQLNLAKLRSEGLHLMPTEFPCDPSEIQELNEIIDAAGSGEINTKLAGEVIMDRLALIINRIQSESVIAI